MKRRIIIFILTAGACICSGQSRTIVATDIVSPFCTKVVRFNVGRALTGNWSVDAGFSINIARISKEWDTLEMAHWNELYGVPDSSRTFRDDFIEGNISLCYWPQCTFCGPVFCAGGSIKDRSGPDITAGAGYFCHIWKGLRAAVIYRIRLIESLRKEHMPAEGITISICYAF